MFEYQIEKNLFSSRGEVKIIDSNKNKYYFGEVYVDTLDNKIVGSNIRVSMSSDSSSLSSENEPRFPNRTQYRTYFNNNGIPSYRTYNASSTGPFFTMNTTRNSRLPTRRQINIATETKIIEINKKGSFFRNS